MITRREVAAKLADYLRHRLTLKGLVDWAEKAIVDIKNRGSVEKMSVRQHKYTAIVRKSRLEYVAICLELNVSARGKDLAAVERNLREAIELYLEDIKEHPATSVSPVSIEELIEFLRDTEPGWYKEPEEGLILKPLEVYEVPSHA